jgi:hypothetical protein
MKCANTNCDRGIGLVSYRRGWWGKRRYCSRQCRDTVVAARREHSQYEQGEASYFEWLFLQPIEKPSPKLTPAVLRVRAR